MTLLENASPEELIQLDRDLSLIEWGEHPENFIFSGVVKTQDERDADDPVKPFPDAEYLRLACRRIFEARIIMIPKSRQMKLTWLLCAYALWNAMFKPHQKIFIQSKKEEDAANLVYNKWFDNARIGFMYNHLPEWLKKWNPATGSYAKLILKNNSIIWGIPEGAHIIRSYTASLFISDECAFQPEFEHAYTAAKPMAHKIVGLSSANPSYFGDLVADTEG